ncbi:MAG: spore maturation protein A [Angelakisella sp.]|jgi:spore maturation protein A|nr:spore maturation protein A [Angelakisella sp.]
MMSFIIGGMILLSIITGAVGGNMAAVSTAAMNGCGQAVELVISLTGTICLWSGVMGIAEKSGLTDALSRAFRPLNRILFRGLSPDSPAIKAVSMNMAANLLGLGNAATPLGLAAMKELEKVNPVPGTASQAMVTFVVLNTASLQILPTTTSYLRLAAGSKEPMEILPAVWLASAVSICVGVLMTRLLRGRGQR